MKVANAARHGEELIELLVDCGPLTRHEVCQKLDWSPGKFTTALKYAREELCPSYDVTIPHPTPDDGWRYQVTTDWTAIEAGASHVLGGIEARLYSVARDVATVLPLIDRRSKEGRRANFLNKHLSHILGTLEEINNG